MRIDIKFYLLVALLGTNLCAWGQARTRDIRGSINTRSFNEVYPVISGDGNTMVLMNDYSDDGGTITLVSRKVSAGRWGEPEEISTLNPNRLNTPGGYCLSFDGNTLIYSTRKGDGVGGYDLWYMTFSDGKWSNPRNYGLPLNSSLHDTYPSLSADGDFLYFSRCNALEDINVRDCKIYVAERKKGRIKGWEPPVELDSKINSGNSLMPRLLSDNRTFVFASDKPGGKGGLDWYHVQRNSQGEWSDPRNMDFINTPDDDKYFSMYYRQDRAFISVTDDRGIYDIVEIDVPEAFQPDKVVIKIGKVLNSEGKPVDSVVGIRDLTTGESLAFTFPDTETGDYTLVIPEGAVYDFSIVPKRSNEFYYSEILDYTILRGSRKESSDYTLQIPRSNSVLGMKTLMFNPQVAELHENNNEELERLRRLLGRNDIYDIEIAAFQDSVITDSIPHPDLTEVITDTTFWEEYIYEYEYIYDYEIDEDSVKSSFPDFTTQELDSLLTTWNDSLAQVRNDTLLASTFLASLLGVDTIETIVDTIRHEDIKYTYHNDITQKRAESLAAALIERGVDEGRINPVGYGDSRKPLTAIKEEEFENGFIEIIFKRR